MYVVKVERTGQLRAWHAETKAGLQQAIAECEMRTHYSNTPHIVTDNNGLRLHLALPHEVKRRLDEQRKQDSIGGKWVAVIALALLLWAVFSRR